MGTAQWLECLIQDHKTWVKLLVCCENELLTQFLALQQASGFGGPNRKQACIAFLTAFCGQVERLWRSVIIMKVIFIQYFLTTDCVALSHSLISF